MTLTKHLALPLIDAAQAQKHVTHNEALALLDALAHLAVSARDAATPPATPAEGDRLLVGAAATGAFAGKDFQVATFLAGGWTFLSPQAGWRVYVADESRLLVFDGAGWIDVGSTFDEFQNLARLGVGTLANAANPLSAKLNAALFTAKPVAESGSGDLRVTLNKEGAANTVSQLYQSGYSGRAETGLTGDDDFRVKVSPDGSTWKDGIVVDRTTGAVSFPNGGPTKIVAFTSSGVYTPTPGLRFADVILFGGGGGGGSGARQAAGAAASGGGGGGGGGVNRGRFTAAQIGAGKVIAIGAGGAPGSAQTTNSTAGNAGAAGGATAFGTLIRAGGGGGGAGGGLAVASGGGGGGADINGGGGSGPTAGAGAYGLANGGAGAQGGSSLGGDVGSGGGGGPAAGAAGAAGGTVRKASAGGGAGGGLTAANAVSPGGVGGLLYVNNTAQQGAAGAAGVSGGAGPSFAAGVGPVDQPGGGGGGGGSSLTAAGNGGAGGFPGGGGGGGGAHQNGGSGGAGGAGGAGYAIIIEYF